MSIILIWTLVLSFVSERVKAQTEVYMHWQNMPSRQLIDKGNGYFFAQRQKPDSSLVCFSIVANRLSKAKDRAERRELCEAYMGLWMVYFFSYFDYSKSFDYLEKSKQAAEGIDDILPRVYLNYGNMYQTMAAQWKDDNLNRKAVDNFRKALQNAGKVKMYEVANLAFANLIAVEWTLGNFDNVVRLQDEYLRYMSRSKKNVEFEYTELLYQGYFLIYKKRPREAVAIFTRQLSIVSKRVEHLRLRFNAYENISVAHAAAGDYTSAIRSMIKAEVLANQYNMKDGKLEVYQLLQQYYAKTGDHKSSDDYRRKYFMLKDSLQNYQQVMGVSELEFLGRIEKANKQIEDMRRRQRVGLIVFVVVLCVVGVVGSLLAVVYRKNRELNQANRVLFKKNNEIQDAEDELRKLHKKEISGLMAAKADAEKAAADARTEAARIAYESITAQQDKDVSAGSTVPSVSANAKYKNSGLSEDDKNALMSAIVEVMTDSDEVYSSDFSVARLAELVDSNYKYVSQVVNEKTGGNFSAFINDYRIKEACRRINSGAYDNLTIEALSNSVGFRSRMSFFTSFKHNTGLSPSEYIRLSKEKRRAQS